MPTAHANGVDLYYESTGEGFPLVWSHEFGGDHRSWEPQVRHFSRGYRVVTYNHRGYPPSSVPARPEDYSQDILVADLHALLDALGIRSCHLGGCSMGANVALAYAIAHPERCRSLIVVGGGAGAVNREQFLAGQAATADALEREGIAALQRNFDTLPARAAFKRKDPRGFAEFQRLVGDHSAQACAHLARGVIARRRTVHELEAKMRALRVPSLIMVGDGDGPCVEPSLFMRQCLPHAGLVVLPDSGHTINIEEPDLFNFHVAEFLAAVEHGRWAGWVA
jgi:pimeloyl-ACP methyl ester carboxylesterase